MSFEALPPKLWLPPKPAIVRAAPDILRNTLDKLFDRELLLAMAFMPGLRGKKGAGPATPGSDIATTGNTIVGTGTHGDAPTASNAFDNNSGTRVAILGGNGAAYIGQDFQAGNSYDIIQVAIRHGFTGSSGYAPTSILVQYSDNGSAWTTLYTWSVTDDLAASLQVSAQFASGGAHRYWRLLQNASSAGYWNVYEAEFRPAV